MDMGETNLYSKLGISRDASPAQMRAAYETLSDNIGISVSPDSRGRLLELKGAYLILANPRARFFYNEFLDKGVTLTQDQILDYLAGREDFRPASKASRHYVPYRSPNDFPLDNLTALYELSKILLQRQDLPNSQRNQEHPPTPYHSKQNVRSQDAVEAKERASSSRHTTLADRLRSAIGYASGKFADFKRAYTVDKGVQETLHRYDSLVNDSIHSIHGLERRINELEEIIKTSPKILNRRKQKNEFYGLTDHLVSKAIEARQQRYSFSERFYFDMFTSLVDRTNLTNDRIIIAQVNRYIKSVTHSASSAVTEGYNSLLQSDLEVFANIVQYFNLYGSMDMQKNFDALVSQFDARINAMNASGYKYGASGLQEIRNGFKASLGVKKSPKKVLFRR